MGGFTDRENQVLMPLISDCVNYGFTEQEALAYIKARLGRPISENVYYKRKRLVDSGQYAEQWMSYFTRVGFVVKHQQIIEVVEMVQQDTIRDYIIEKSKPSTLKNQDLILKLRYEIRENAKLLQELSLGTPVIAQIKARLENNNHTNAIIVMMIFQPRKNIRHSINSHKGKPAQPDDKCLFELLGIST